MMTLLKDVTTLFAIKIDYFMWDEKKEEEYTKPHFLTIDTEIKDKSGNPLNLLIFKKEITANLRVFNTHTEAVKYIAEKPSLKSPCYGENVRVVKIKYNFNENKWEEVDNEK